MKILDTNIQPKSPFPHVTKCNKCGSKLEVDEEDVHIGYMGAYHFKCPVCGEESMIDELNGILVTKDNITFPDHFYQFGNGVEMNNEEVQESIREGIEHFRKYPDEFSWYSGFGDKFVAVYNNSDDYEYYIMVAKDYYETHIHYELEDYNAQNRVRY